MKKQLKIISNRSIIEVINYSKTNPNVIIDIPIPYEIDNKKTDKVIDKIIKRTEKEVETLKGNIENLELTAKNDYCKTLKELTPAELHLCLGKAMMGEIADTWEKCQKKEASKRRAYYPMKVQREHHRAMQR